MKQTIKTTNVTYLSDSSYCAILERGLDIMPFGVYQKDDLCILIEMTNRAAGQIDIEATVTKNWELVQNFRFVFRNEGYNMRKPVYSALISFMDDVMQRVFRGAMSWEKDFEEQLTANIASGLSGRSMTAKLDNLFNV